MYSDEEKKSIQMIRNQKEIADEALIAMENPENYIGEDVEQEYLEWQRNAETILNLIEKQSKAIERLKTKNNDLLRKLRNRVKEVKKLQKYSLYKNEFANLNKIINEMAEFLENELTIDTFCTKKNCYADEYINGHCQKCLDCIKEYFEEKVKGEK